MAALLRSGLLCYFGRPHTNEYETKRALQMGLALIQTTQKIVKPDAIVEMICQRTDSMPWFVEELTKKILESGALNEFAKS